MAGHETHYILPRPSFERPVKLLIVVAPYYKDIADDLVAGAKAEIEAVGGRWDLIEVPGALEIPTAIGIAERMANFDGYVALGCIIRGETYHFELVANESGAGVSRISLDYNVPIANAILTTENLEQAMARQTEKGRDAARVAVEMAMLMEDLSIGIDELDDEELA